MQPLLPQTCTENIPVENFSEHVMHLCGSNIFRLNLNEARIYGIILECRFQIIISAGLYPPDFDVFNVVIYFSYSNGVFSIAFSFVAFTLFRCISKINIG